MLDNAEYQRSYLVQQKAKASGIDLIYLPPYSPNLNLIERLWRYFKKKVMKNK
ncbi:MAG: transposase, partial [Chitinophagaceae bacterium]